MSSNRTTCEQCRRASQKLFLKGERCLSPKCALTRRPYGPGQHGKNPRRVSEFGRQLLVKQQAAGIYGIRNRQFKRYVTRASAKLGATNEALLQLLERRLDNVVFRLGLAVSRSTARMLIKDRHLLINGKLVTVASYLVRPGDVVSIKDKTIKQKKVFEKVDLSKFHAPAWLKLDDKKLSGEILRLPNREDIDVPFDEKLIIEYYSR